MLQNSSILKTIGIFFKEPTKKHYLMDISRKIKIAHTSVKNNLKNLIKRNMIIEYIEKKGTRKFPVYTANITTRAFKKYKIIYNITTLMESQTIDYIEDTFAPKSIVLFGSYRRGEDIEESDIDLFIECKKGTINLDKFEKKLGRKIELHFKEYFTSYPKELKNNIINGVVLSGFLEGYK